MNLPVLTAAALDIPARQPSTFMPAFMVLIIFVIIVLAVVFLLIVFLGGEGKGVRVTSVERLLEGLGDRKEEFLRKLEGEAARRGVLLRAAGEEGDMIHEDFFNRVTVYAHPEGENLRYGFSVRITTAALVLGILLLIFFFVGGIVLFLVWYFKYGSLKDALSTAGEAAAVLARG